MVFKGLFSRFGDLRVVLVEGGFAWAPPVMWRMDQTWRGIRTETPWVKRPPSEYVREHVRFTTAPMPRSPAAEHVVDTIEMLGGAEMLLFGSDFPHWDADDPATALPEGLSAQDRRRILSENARELYELGAAS
jgi:uncharacterized protein